MVKDTRDLKHLTELDIESYRLYCKKFYNLCEGISCEGISSDIEIDFNNHSIECLSQNEFKQCLNINNTFYKKAKISLRIKKIKKIRINNNYGNSNDYYGKF